MIAQTAILAVPLLAAIIFHEVAHGAVAYLCGDPTAARAGRLTLNPIPHIDPIGSVVLPGLLLLLNSPFLFGYAKPVPIDPRYFHHPRRDEILVALAGPGTNLILAALSTLVLGLLITMGEPTSEPTLLQRMAATSIQVNCLLAVFNLLPIPPLDGGHLLSVFLPARSAKALRAIEGIGMVIVLLVVMNTPILGLLVTPVVHFFFRLVPQ